MIHFVTMLPLICLVKISGA